MASPFHDISVKIITQQIFNNRCDLHFTKRATDGPSASMTAPSGSNPATAASSPVIWEVGVSQKRTSLLRRAKTWCRRYDSQVRVVILVKYLRRDPRTDNASILEVYRPLIRQCNGCWTAVREDPMYQLFPRPDTVFDLPLELVREVIETLVPMTIRREQSGGLSVLGDVVRDGEEEVLEVEIEGRESPVEDEVIAYGWDAAMSDVSDDFGGVRKVGG
ncbi:hypothetical protein Q9L58_010285 [Maublancomyces gigas]|uniref:Transposase n=1 Tax=Discina gigas TaxID=1032678 RepID=A0ABR3G4I8_9PEZI